MKLVRYGRPGAEKPGLVDVDGTLRDLTKVVDDITPDLLTQTSLRRLRAVKTAKLPIVRGRPRLGCPLAGIGKMVCIGLNYTDHAEEVGMALPKEPTVFIKAPSALCGPDDATIRPRGGTKLDYECELAAVIGRDALNVDQGKALAHVAAYCIVNDVSERAFQMEHGGTTTKGKSADSFGPVGPWLVTADEIPDPQALSVAMRINGETRQSSHTSKMIFPVDECIAVLSQGFTVLPGDVIATGTPEGVGAALGKFLKAGDKMEAEVEKIGVLTNKIVAP